MKQFWAVTTCPRPGLPDGYMPEFNRRAAGWFGSPFHIFVDEMLEGQVKNFLQVLEVGMAEGADRFNVFEDDAVGCVGAFDVVARTPLPVGCELASWFDAVIDRVYGHPRWDFADCRDFFNMQAISLTRRAAAQILDAGHAHKWPLRHAGDLMIAQALQGFRWARFVPSLFQHGGEVSVCNPGTPLGLDTRHSRTFVGRGFDARTLRAPK